MDRACINISSVFSGVIANIRNHTFWRFFNVWHKCDHTKKKEDKSEDQTKKDQPEETVKDKDKDQDQNKTSKKKKDERYLYVDNLFVHLLQSNNLVNSKFLDQRQKKLVYSTSLKYAPPANAQESRQTLIKQISPSVEKLRHCQHFDWECYIVNDLENVLGFSTPGGKIVLSTGLLLKLKKRYMYVYYIHIHVHIYIYFFFLIVKRNSFFLFLSSLLHKGLIDKLVEKDEDCAAVLCHEIAHVICRHVVEGWQRSLGWQFLVFAIMFALGIDLSGGLDSILGKMVLYGGQLPMQRKMELEADEVAIYLMLCAGYDPSALVRTMEKLANIENKEINLPTFMLTHPPSDDRKKELELKIERIMSNLKQAKH
ncbi:M48 family zinc metallopeptidase [Reticulomyxa filosa]|uniref:M48 family zinc metallopeptidase n=1 Tax=Reticulomyxa filosa TaxID=46433 RepID=X6M997_RETFI|nr:M48 family zinc metallopeptidase [Reticulomyxa filosa]|eukprot:ETO10052.1 M48 family zinc metallopeptidase [Reticulomyxa filosa]